jgi:gliding motility-associated transport system permease protein
VAESIRNIRAIAAKELRSYYSAPVAWVIFGLFAALFGAFFSVGLLSFVQASMSQFGGPQRAMNVNLEMIRPVLANTSVLILFIVPMITMRTYAEEKRSGTIELLLTSPLKDVEIVLGKFLGAMGMYLGLLAVTTVYVAILFLTGNPAFKPLIAGYLGLLLVGGSFISLGLFFSSLTNNQMVAGVASFVVFLVLWIIGWFSDNAGPFWSQILNYLSIIVPFDDFGKGVIDTKHIIRYLSFIVLGLFLATKSVDSDRWRG